MSNATDPRIALPDEKPGSERSFGLVFAAVFALIGLAPLRHGEDSHWFILVLAACFAAAGLLVPSVLRPLNIVWFQLGRLMGRVVNPVVMGAVFFLGMTPIGIILRLCGKDLLSLKLDSKAASYWIARDSAAPASQTMKNQF